MMVNQESVESMQRRIDAQGRRITYLEEENQQLNEEIKVFKAAFVSLSSGKITFILPKKTVRKKSFEREGLMSL